MSRARSGPAPESRQATLAGFDATTMDHEQPSPPASATAPADPPAEPLVDHATQPRSGSTDDHSRSTALRTGLDALDPAMRTRVESLSKIDEEQVDRLCDSLSAGLATIGFERPRVEIELRSLPGLQASVERARGGKARARERVVFTMTDGFVLAPDTAVRGLAVALGLRVLPRRRRVTPMADMLRDNYELWMQGREARDLHSSLRRARARKQGKGPKGTFRDLADLHARVSQAFLGGPERVPPVRVTWSSRAGYRVFGHHDGDVDTIVISRSLDDPNVPEAVVAFVLYHELLHHVMDTRRRGVSERRSVHPPAFRRRERRFPNWELCDEYLTFMATYRRARKQSNAPEPWHALWETDWTKPRRFLNRGEPPTDSNAVHGDGGALTTLG